MAQLPKKPRNCCTKIKPALPYCCLCLFYCCDAVRYYYENFADWGAAVQIILKEICGAVFCRSNCHILLPSHEMTIIVAYIWQENILLIQYIGTLHINGAFLNNNHKYFTIMHGTAKKKKITVSKYQNKNHLVNIVHCAKKKKFWVNID